MSTTTTSTAPDGPPEPGPRPGLPTAGVPAVAAPSRAIALGRALRPVLWLAVAAGTLWPLTPRAVVAAVLVLLGGAAAVTACRDPRIPTGDGTAWRAGLLTVTVLTGVSAIVLVPPGAGYVPAYVAASLLGRLVVEARVVWAVSGAGAVLVSLALAVTTASPWGLLAGIGVPLVASRALDRARLRREHARVVALLAEREARRASELAAAAAGERARIARDLHDVLAHTLSGLSLHLQGIRALLAARDGADALPGDPVIAAVDRAADLARNGLTEAKEAVAALRPADDDPAAAPSAADLATLVAGHDATLTVSGSGPPGAADVPVDPRGWDTLDPAVRGTVLATVREALTNAGRHAPGASVRVAVALGPDGEGVTVRVDDDGPTPGSSGGPAARRHPDAATARGDVGGGRGLSGLAERAALVGGRVEAGPRGAGWRVALRVPADAAARWGTVDR